MHNDGQHANRPGGGVSVVVRGARIEGYRKSDYVTLYEVAARAAAITVHS